MRRTRPPRARLAALAALPLVAVSAMVWGGRAAHAAATWTPGPASYDVYEKDDIPITVTNVDGKTTTVLRANVGLPAPKGSADPVSSKAPAPAAGQFPVIVTQTPYRKDGGLFGVDKYFVQRGYAYVIVDVRGTGSSQGSWDSFGAQEQHDGPQIVHWAAHQSWANGRVGLVGASYLAINQLLTMEQADAPTEVKAIFPVVPMSDAYRDVTYHGGNLDGAFIPPWLGLVTSLGAQPGHQTLDGDPNDFQDGLQVMAQHTADVAQFQGPAVQDSVTGSGHFVTDGPFSQLRSPLWRIDRIHVPTFIVGGEFDIFQRGEPLLYNALKVPAKRLIIGPWIHLEGSTASTLPADGIPDLHTLQLQWFDQYVKGEDTGEDSQPRVEQYELKATDASHFVAAPTYPMGPVQPLSLFLDGTASGSATSLHDGSLTTAPPSTTGSDALAYAPGTGCTRTTFQWGDASATQAGVNNAPCEQDQRVAELGSLTYTTAALTQPLTINGPINVHLVAENPEGRDIIFTVRVTDVAPDGTSTALSAGWLQASFRKEAVQAPVTFSADGVPLRVFHPFTPDSVETPPAGPTPYDVEVFPTFATFQAGHRIRLDVASGDTPHLAPSLPHDAAVAGAVFMIDRGGAAAVGGDPTANEHSSYVSLPVIRDDGRVCSICPAESGARTTHVGSGNSSNGNVRATASVAGLTSTPNTQAEAAGARAALVAGVAVILLVAVARRRRFR